MADEVEDTPGGAEGRAETGKHEPPVFKFEINWVDGREGEALAREQTAAIRDVLQWVAEHRSPDSEPMSDAQDEVASETEGCEAGTGMPGERGDGTS